MIIVILPLLTEQHFVSVLKELFRFVNVLIILLPSNTLTNCRSNNNDCSWGISGFFICIYNYENIMIFLLTSGVSLYILFTACNAACEYNSSDV